MNNNAQAVAFSNTRIRPMSDLLYSAYLSAKKLVQEWNSQNVSAVIPNDATIIGDGATTDGRPQITDSQATTIVTRCQDLINWMEGSQAIAAGDGTKAVLNTVTACEVNGDSKF
jgi:hypothetical protein